MEERRDLLQSVVLSSRPDFASFAKPEIICTLGGGYVRVLTVTRGVGRDEMILTGPDPVSNCFQRDKGDAEFQLLI